LRRNCFAIGQPSTIATSPEANAVTRQPWLSIAPAITGTRTPPSASPSPTADKARARWTWNQWMIATLIGKKPQRLEPSAMTTKAA
jgi:hypothetical protein